MEPARIRQVLSAPRLGFSPFDYQLATMQTVLRRMRGRAILADEVGLGKTIEAGLVLSELRMRGLADRALVITPAGLVGQWREELERKFAVPATIAARGGWEVGEDRSVVLASLAAARRDPLRSALTRRELGHGDRRRGASAAEPGQRLGTAGPGPDVPATCCCSPPPRWRTGCRTSIELVNLAARVCWAPQPSSAARTARADTQVGALRNVASLRERTRRIMVRHRRSEVEVLLPQRLAETVLVTPCEAEASLYAELTARIRAEAAGAAAAQRLALRSLTRAGRFQPGRGGTHPGQGRLARPAERARAIRRPRKTAELLSRLRPTSGAGRRCWCSPRSGTPSTRWPPRSRRRASRRPPITAACPGGRRTPRSPPSAATRPSC